MSDPSHRAITAVVLAGGLSRRMGRDKGLAPWRGRPLVAQVLAVLKPQVGTIYLNTANPDYRQFDLPLLPDTLPDQPGPLAGTLAALEAVREGLVLTVPCDTPRLPPDLVARLADALEREQAELAVAGDGERLHPVIALMRPELAPALRAYLERGERRVQAWVRSRRHAVVRFAPEDLANLNTPADLEAP